MIDILIPYYGDSTFLEHAVTSVLNQTDPRWSLTVVDDNATPSAAVGPWIDSLGDTRVSYVANESTLGLTANFQRCLDLSSSEFVTIMGCDDMLLPNYVEVVSKAIERIPQAAAYHPRVTVIDSDGSSSCGLPDRVKRLLAPRADADALLGGERLAATLMTGNWLYFPSITWRRSALDSLRFRPDLPTTLDLDLAITLILAGEQFAILRDAAFAYRRHDASASSRAALAAERFDEEASFFTACRTSFTSRGWRRAALAARWHLTSRLHAVVLVPRAARTKQWHLARRLVVHALDHH
jgi:glycosyltransferase involved in cell wall biosynthesis